MDATEAVDSQDGAATWAASSGGIISRPGWTAPGQIGRPGPGLPGLSRFWQLRLLPGAPAATIAEVTGSFVATGTDDSLAATEARPGHPKWFPGMNKARAMRRSQIFGFGFADKKGLPE